MSLNEKPYPITGGKVTPGQPLPLRQEFNAWSNNYEQSIPVSLFIRALQLWYGMDYKDMLSYFRIASIHGYPQRLSWNGVSNNSMFCNHSVPTFPTWHRPYMLLFEQRLSELMIEVIDGMKFPVPSEKEGWLDAAANWRLPYWDWGLPSTAGQIPFLFTEDSISIRQPLEAAGVNPTTVTVSNPLSRYQLKTGEVEVPTPMGDLKAPFKVNDVKFTDPPLTLPWSQCAGTSRWGITSNEKQDKWSLGINNWRACNSAIGGHQFENPGTPINLETVTDLCYRILSPQYAQDWYTFATTGTDRRSLTEKDWVKYLSLEYIHNALHGFIGGDAWNDGIGHMQNVPSAAFDPVFFMHHANVDRLFATYQTLYPNNWFAPQSPSHHEHHLKPFYKSSTQKFTSDDVRDWTQYGYQYDMLERQPNESDEEYIARINAWVKTNYGGSAALLIEKPESFLGRSEPEHYDDYIIDIVYDRRALNGHPYTIVFYINQITTEDVSTRADSKPVQPHLVGSVFNFSTPTIDEDGQRVCENCDEQEAVGSLATGQIPLTAALFHQAARASVEWTPDAVEQHLATNLHWVVVSAGGYTIPTERLTDLKVYVLRGNAQHPSARDSLSTFQDYVPLSSVTQGKVGGAQEHEYRGQS